MAFCFVKNILYFIAIHAETNTHPAAGSMLCCRDFSIAFDSIHKGKMKQIRQTYGLPKETVTVIIIINLLFKL